MRSQRACYADEMEPPEPTVRRWSSVHDFLAASREFLAAREAEHCLIFGIASVIESNPEIYPDPRFWTVHEGDRVVAAALRTPPHNLLLSQIDDPRALAALTADALATDELPGVLGPTAAARSIADAWSARTGGVAKRTVQERIFRLDRVQPPQAAPGGFREVEERDRALLAAWWSAFCAEATPHAPRGNANEAADRMLRRAGRVAYLWEDGGTVVSLGAASGPTPRGIRIGPVYTPPQLRRRGYASNLVASITERQLASGRDFCFLFTDIANATSNHIYQEIGYAPVTDVDEYRFAASA